MKVALACALGMLAGFLLSRVLLSFSIFAFGLNALIGTRPGEWFRNKWWVLGLAWVGIYVVSFFWSDNIPQWNERVSVKLPILLLPLAFGLLPSFSDRQLKIFTIGGALLFLSGVGYSLYFLVTDTTYYIEQYRFSKVLPTLAGHDYIRYSLSIALFIVWCVYMLGRWGRGSGKWLIVVTVAVLSIYIHIVAVKTGILSLYLFVLCYGIYMAARKKLFFGLVLIAMIIATPFVAYKYVPTFENKVDYFTYSWKVFNEGQYNSDYSDIGRLVSYDIALKLMPGHMWLGTGIGDLHDVMKTGYDKYYPLVPDFQRLKPHNQFMIVALGCGIPALILFILWVFYPLRFISRSREGFFLFCVWLVMWIPLMVEPFLELQFGIYVYLFFILWMAQCSRKSIPQNIGRQ